MRRRLKNSLRGRGAHFHERPGMQDIFLDRGANPPHGIGREAEPALRIEALDRLHHADIALGDELGNRQAVAAIAHGDLGHQSQMAGDQLMRGIGVAMLAPAFGEHVFLLRLQHRELADLGEVARQVAVGRQDREILCSSHVRHLVVRRLQKSGSRAADGHCRPALIANPILLGEMWRN
jgi:hypothetical protein